MLTDPKTRVSMIILTTLLMTTSSQGQHSGKRSIPPGAPKTAFRGRPAVHAPTKAKIEREWADFKKRYPGNWKVRYSDKSGLPRTIYGGKIAPRQGNLEQAARAFVEANKALLGLDFQGMQVEFDQSRQRTSPRPVRRRFHVNYLGLKMYRGGIISILFDENDQIIKVDLSVWPIDDLRVQPRLSSEQVAKQLRKLFANRSISFDPPELSIFPDGPGRLVYGVTVAVTSTEGYIEQVYGYVVDADTGEILLAENLRTY